MRLYQVDSFTDEAFRGNPAAVVVLDDHKDDAWLQHLAAEMNLSETAFVSCSDEGVQLRWFTPREEVKLCGHATLAAAFVLFETGMFPKDHNISFQSRSGLLQASWRQGKISLDFPVDRPQPAQAPPLVLEALGAEPLYVGTTRVEYLMELDSEATVRGLQPQMERLALASRRGIIATARSANPKYDFVSRFFAPSIGIPEDPVTGSAHCSLAPYWQSRLGKTTFRAYQASQRGGALDVQLAEERVILSGQAVLVFSANLHV